MASGIDALSLYQVGIQSAFGTAVAATAKLAVQRIDFDDDGVIYRPALAKGIMVRNRGNETVVKNGTLITIPDTPVYYEQLHTFLQAFLKAEALSGSDPYTHTFTRSLTADPALKYLTIERRVKDFSTSEDMEIADCVFDSMTFKYTENGTLMFSATGFGRKSDDSSTLTAAQSMPTPEFAPSALSSVYIDTSWGGLGGTLVASQVIGFELTIKNGAMAQMTADARAAMDYTVVVHNPNEMTLALRLTCLMDPTTFAAERDAAKAATLRAIQIKVEGSQSRSIKLNGLYKYTKPGILMLGEQNGQVIATYDLEETNDGTNWVEAIIVNKTNEPDGV